MLQKPNNDIIRSQYKNYRNKLVSLIRETKQMFYKEIMHGANSKTLWNITKDIIHEKRKHEINSITLKDKDGNDIADDKYVANEFNTFFSTVGENMANTKLQLLDNSKQKHDKLQIANTFVLDNVTETEVINYINELRPGCIKQCQISCQLTID